MGILNSIYSRRASVSSRAVRRVQGSFAVNRDGALVASTLGSEWSHPALDQIGRTVLDAFARAREVNQPLDEVTAAQSGFKIVARELRGGALVFLRPESPAPSHPSQFPPFTMSHPVLKDFALYLETYIECWKQFNYYLGLARSGKFTPEDEAQFLELKSLITQGLEVILAVVERGAPNKDEVMALITATPSLRFLAEHEQSLFNIEGQWHKLFLVMESLMGRLKVAQQKREGRWRWHSLFGRR